MRVTTHGQTDTDRQAQTDFIIYPMLYAIAMGQMIIDFKYGGLPPSWIFKICTFSHSWRFRAMICMFLQRLVAIGRTVAELLQIIDFQYSGRPPFWVRCTHARDHQQSDIVGHYHCAKFGLNRLSSFDNIEV